MIWALDEIDRQVARSPRIDGASYTLPDGDAGPRYRADELLAMIDATTSTILRMYAARWNLTDKDGALVIPLPVAITEDQEANAEVIQDLAQAWDAWRRVDDNIRFFGGEIVEEFGGDDGRGLWRHVPSREGLEWQRLNLAGHELLTAEITSIFNRLVFRENAHEQATGIEGAQPLFPQAYVCAGELQAAEALDIFLSTTIEEDTTLYSGLRLAEWIRGYATLILLAEAAARAPGGAERLLIVKTGPEVVALLERLGLGSERAKRFIRNVTFSRRSRDMVDEPLIRLEGDRYLLFGPTLAHGEITRILLSKLSQDRASFERRGKRFEADMLRHFHNWGLEATAFRTKRGGQEYDFDLLVPWEGHLFLFECKSRGATGIDPARAWQAQQNWRSALHQTRRLADALRDHPDMIVEALGPAALGLKLVPCVLNAFPLQVAGPVDGVYFTDMAALAVF